MLNRSGSTIVEVLIALVIFSLIFFPLTTLLRAESRFQGSYQDKAISIFLAKSEIEKIKVSCWEPKDAERIVTAAGKKWKLKVSVESDNASIKIGDDLLHSQFVTVSVSRERDTVKLSEFKVMRQTYQ